jgi:hypothetical protein
VRQSRPTPCDGQDSTAPGGPTMHYISEAEAHAREAGRLFEWLAVENGRPEYGAMAAVLFGAASKLRADRLALR